MRKILNIILKDLSVMARDWPALILVIAAPLFLTIGLGLVTGSFNRDDDAPSVGRIPMIVIDQDGGQLATALVGLFQSKELSELLAPETWDDEAAALEQVRNGDAAAVVIIPAGFSDSFIPDRATGRLSPPVALRVIGDPGSPIRAEIVRSIAESFTTRAETGVSTVQISLTQLMSSGAIAPDDLPAVAQSLGEQMFAGTEEPGMSADTASLIRVNSESATAGGESFNPLSYIAPAMALFFLMYAVSLGARTMLTERSGGTLARMLAAPVTPAQVLSGKVAGIFLTGFLQVGVLILLSVVLFGLNWGNPLAVIILIAAAALAATGWGLLLASISANPAQVGSLGMALTLIFGILGGSLFPISSDRVVLDIAGRITPNRWALDGFTSLALGEGLSSIAIPVAALLIMAAILFVVSAVVFRRRQSSLLIG